MKKIDINKMIENGLTAVDIAKLMIENNSSQEPFLTEADRDRLSSILTKLNAWDTYNLYMDIMRFLDRLSLTTNLTYFKALYYAYTLITSFKDIYYTQYTDIIIKAIGLTQQQQEDFEKLFKQISRSHNYQYLQHDYETLRRFCNLHYDYIIIAESICNKLGLPDIPKSYRYKDYFQVNIEQVVFLYNAMRGQVKLNDNESIADNTRMMLLWEELYVKKTTLNPQDIEFVKEYTKVGKCFAVCPMIDPEDIKSRQITIRLKKLIKASRITKPTFISDILSTLYNSEEYNIVKQEEKNARQ